MATTFQIKYLPSADLDLIEIDRFLTQNNSKAFIKILKEIDKTANSLKIFPNLGKRYKNYRRLVINEYQIFYEIDQKNFIIKVHRILHCSRNINKSLIN